MPRIFISYRRNDSAGHAGRLYDRLRAHFGADRVFMDVTGIEAGTDFVETIDAAVGSCDVLIAVIGREWTRSADDAGRRRLELPNDFIRLEVGSALNRKVRVVPVLVEGALMPAEGDLPAELRTLTRRQAVELRDSRWDADVEDLIASLERIPGTSMGAGVGQSSSQPPTQPPPRPSPASDTNPAGSGSYENPAVKSALPWIAGAGALLAVVLLGFWMAQRDARPQPEAPAPTPAPVAIPSRDSAPPAPVAGSAPPAVEGKTTGVVRDKAPANVAKVAPAKPVVTPPKPSEPRPRRAAETLPSRPKATETAPAHVVRADTQTAPEPVTKPEPVKPPPAPRSPPSQKKLTLVVWGNSTSRVFWNGLKPPAYSERMAGLLAAVLRDRVPAGMEVQHAAARDTATRITQPGAGDQVANVCRETRATWVFAAHMEEPYASSPAESAYWPELRLAAARCASPDPVMAKETLAPRQGEAFPFANDLRAAVLRFVREQMPMDR
jgi:hypothetical protein